MWLVGIIIYYFKRSCTKAKSVMLKLSLCHFSRTTHVKGQAAILSNNNIALWANLTSRVFVEIQQNRENGRVICSWYIGGTHNKINNFYQRIIQGQKTGYYNTVLYNVIRSNKNVQLSKDSYNKWLINTRHAHLCNE